MIELIKSGNYKLIETTHHTKILKLGRNTYAWIVAGGIGEILVRAHARLVTDYILAVGSYRLYSVRSEPNIIDQQHLELEVGRGSWQGYLLPTGLPQRQHKRSRIIPTKELISTGVTRHMQFGIQTKRDTGGVQTYGDSGESTVCARNVLDE